ncbi:MAG: hypothetical protein HOM11_09960 [Methylococcales bacterium]|jgi:hypothetical protein|nr:hypothetical protein [Methylococcales bacterium]MBT7445668.1 hypothetical protein [Methylococcales bacterium]
MNREQQYEANKAYIEAEGLDKIIPFFSQDTSATGQTPIAPQAEELVRLHKLIRSRKCFTAIEFGVGFSTVVMADALYKNKQDWENKGETKTLRNRFLFQLFSVDASQQWLDTARSRVPEHLLAHCNFHYSDVKIGQHQGQLCHYYETLPDVIADFIYLDGPAPQDVKGNVNGLSFQCHERTVISADLLLMETTFLPGTFIIIDGRTNNARFLQRNFTRNYTMFWDRENDLTTFELNEERLGPHNILGTDD